LSYDSAFFDDIREGAQRSAEAVVPIVLERYAAKRVVDVGCGEGYWGAEFAKHGCEVLGIEAHAEPVIPSVKRDLAKPFALSQSFDLAVCLEVVEHLPSSRAKGFVSDLCRLAPVVLFSAAVPNQGGEGHLNEQWPTYWAALFERQGFTLSGAPRWEVWEDERVEFWYRQNLMVAAVEPADIPAWFDTSLSEPFPVIHPAFFGDDRW
jgi:SAM-dependent methyltransferase